MKTLQPKAGIFALLRACLGSAGAGASSLSLRRRLAAVSAAAVLVLLLVQAVLSAAASADTRIGEHGNGPGGLETPKGIAVSRAESGDLYVLDAGENQRVDEFGPDGSWVRAFGWGVVPGAATASGDLTAGSSSLSNATALTGAFVLGQPVSGPGIPAGTVIAKVTSSALELSNPATERHENATLIATAGPGNVPTNEVQSLTVAATAGAFRLEFKSPNPGATETATAPLTVNAAESKPSASEVQTALEALSNIGPGNVSVSGGPADEKGEHPYLIEFKGRFADANVHPLKPSGSGLSGGSPASQATLATTHQGAGAVETCAADCVRENVEEGREPGQGSAPGQLRYSEEIAIDNSCAQHEPPLTELTTPTCAEFDSSYGDVYVVDQRNFRVEKYDAEGHFLLMFGGEVDKGPHHPGDLCTAAYLAEGDSCAAGVPGTGPAHFYESGALSWANEGDNSITVGREGKVYVGDYGRIQEFEPSGEFAGEFTLPLEAKPTQFVTSLALDSSGDLFERSATIGSSGEALSEVPGVREWSAAHTLLHAFDTEEASSEPTHLALDFAGDLFVADHGGGGFRFRAFRPAGALFAEFDSDQLLGQFASDPRGIAIGAADLYATTFAPEGVHVAVHPLPVAGPPAVTEERATDVEPLTATLRAIVNPEQFDTTYQFQWITQKSFEEDGDSFGAGTEAMPATPADLGSVSRDVPVDAPISALSPHTLYRWRVLAVNSEGTTAPEETFETLPDVSVRDFTTQTVAPEEVVLKAELNDNNSLIKGHWQICLGAAAGAEPGDYSLGCKEGELGAGSSSFEEVTATFTGLGPNAPYHYRLFAENSYGQVESADQALTTEETIAEQDASEGCSNSLRREEDNSTALPDCRAYEQVSPAFKGGYPVLFNHELAPGGERDSFSSLGAFAGTTAIEGLGTQYLAHRTTSGWATQPLGAFPAGPGLQPEGFLGFSAGLDSWLSQYQQGFDLGQAQYSKHGTIYLHGADGSVAPASPTFEMLEGNPDLNWYLPIAASSDFSRLFVATWVRLIPPPGDPRPSDPTNGSDLPGSRIYQVEGPGSTPRLVAETPPDLPALGCGVDNSTAHVEERPWASADGSTLFYTVPLDIEAGQPCDAGGASREGPNKAELFAWHGGSSVQVSAESSTQCTSPHPCKGAARDRAIFDGISPDGRLAWFTTRQPLIDSDADAGNDLYLARLNEGQVSELVQASAGEAAPGHPLPGQGAGVLGVVQVSEDGTHIAFVAHGALTAAPNAAGSSALPEADNLYVYDSTSGRLGFVASLCSGPGESGTVRDHACPVDLAGESDLELLTHQIQQRAQFTPDGRYLLFETFARLADDTDNALDVYRYDAETGELTRVSIGRDGNDADGNDSAFPATLGFGGGSTSGSGVGLDSFAGDLERSISADGSTAVFETDAPLVSRDVNRATDVYEWEEAGHGSCPAAERAGCVSLVSSGRDPHGATQGRIGGPSGRDIAFFTPQGLVPADTDGVADIYDARVGGGFPFVPPPETPVCVHGSAEACHGESTREALRPSYASEETRHGPEKPGEERLRCAKGKHRIKKHGQVRCVAAKRHKHAKHRHPHRGAVNHRRPGGAK